MKTNLKSLEALYDTMVVAMQAALDQEGGAGAPTLNVIRQFLKDAGIEAKATRGSALGNLAGSLPTFDDEGDGAPPPYSA